MTAMSGGRVAGAPRLLASRSRRRSQAVGNAVRYAGHEQRCPEVFVASGAPDCSAEGAAEGPGVGNMTYGTQGMSSGCPEVRSLLRCFPIAWQPQAAGCQWAVAT
jgi:hypothetical protein